MNLTITPAEEPDAPAIAALRTAVGDELTRRYGKGHWSGEVKVKGVVGGIKTSRVLVARNRRTVVATLRLQTKKPWAIDRTYFADVPRALYLLDMAVSPSHQGKGIGRRLVREAIAVARAWPSHAIRLDAYDADAGAGGFYAKCGFREVGRVTYRGTKLVYFELLLSV